MIEDFQNQFVLPFQMEKDGFNFQFGFSVYFKISFRAEFRMPPLQILPHHNQGH